MLIIGLLHGEIMLQQVFVSVVVSGYLVSCIPAALQDHSLANLWTLIRYFIHLSKFELCKVSEKIDSPVAWLSLFLIYLHVRSTSKDENKKENEYSRVSPIRNNI